jgi:hypothetical protein
MPKAAVMAGRITYWMTGKWRFSVHDGLLLLISEKNLIVLFR